MSQIKLKHSGGNSSIIAAPSSNPASDVTFRLPNADGSAGQFMKTDGSGNLSFGAAGGGKIKQWISTTKQDTATFSVSSSSIYHYTDTSLRVTITPTSASNFLYIMGHVSVGRDLLNWMHVGIDKDGADFALASASGAGSRRAAAASGTNSQTDMPVTMPFHAKVSAESTAERYYSLAFSHGSSSTRTMRINRGTDNTDNYAYPRNISTITVIEVEV